jgi:hypothetical protein
MGIYPDLTTVSDALIVLTKAGHRATDISVLSSDNLGSKDFAHEKHNKAVILLSVHCDSPEWCDRAKKTLQNTGAHSISSASEAAADYGTTNKPTESGRAVVTVRAETPATRMPERVPVEIEK